MWTRRRILTHSGALAAALLCPPSLTAQGGEPSGARQGTESGDRLHGMFTMGAYGDALGAWHEAHGALKGRIADPATCHLGATDLASAHPWGYWVVRADGPMVTDDTSYRTCILHPYLAHCLSTGATIDEAGMMSWLAQPRSPHAPISALQARQAADWLAMQAAARDGRAHLFYTPGSPVVFGPYMWLEAASLWARAPGEEIFEHFASMSSLDQAEGRAFTGLMAVLMAEAHAAPKLASGSFPAWCARTMDAWLERLAASHTTHDVATLRDAARAVSAPTQPWFEGEPFDFVHRLRMGLWEDHPTRAPAQQPYLSIRFLETMRAALARAGSDDDLLLRLLASSAGDSDTMASMMGALMGAAYGRGKSGRIVGRGGALEADLRRVESVLSRDFGVRMGERVELFEALRGRSIRARVQAE